MSNIVKYINIVSIKMVKESSFLYQARKKLLLLSGICYVFTNNINYRVIIVNDFIFTIFKMFNQKKLWLNVSVF